MQLQRENIGKKSWMSGSFYNFYKLKTFCEGAFIIILTAKFLLQPISTA